MSTNKEQTNIPEVTDNVMRKANQAIARHTGVTHIGATGRIVQAIWEAMEEDLRAGTNQGEGQGEGEGDSQSDKGELTLTPNNPQKLWRNLKETFAAHHRGTGKVVDQDVYRDLEKLHSAAHSDAYIGTFTDDQLSTINWAKRFIKSYGAGNAFSSDAMAELGKVMSAYNPSPTNSQAQTNVEQAERLMQLGDSLVKQITPTDPATQKAATDRFVAKHLGNDLDDDPDPDDSPGPR